MKVHYEQASSVAYGYADIAMQAWKKENLIPWVERYCDGKMMFTKNELFLNDDIEKVTCKRCLQKKKRF